MKSRLLSVFLFCLFLFSSLSAQGLNFHGSVKNSIYSYESEKNHTNIYQYARFSVATANNNITLNTLVRALTDANNSLDSDERFKAYSLNIRFNKFLWNRLNLTVGRQFLHPGTVLGALDGVNGQLALFKNISLQFYGGTESHFQRSFKIYDAEDSFVTGGLLKLKKFYSTAFQFLYLQKSNKDNTFWQLTGLNVDSKILPSTHIRVQSHYDLQNENMHRLLVSARHTWSDRLQTTLGYKNQNPQVYANSYFTIFELDPYRQYRASAAYEFLPGLYVDGQYQFIQFDGDNANRAFLTLQNNNGSIGFVYEQGYAGDQIGLIFDYAYELFPNVITSLFIDYSKYRTEEIYEYENQLANAIRVSYRFNRHFSVDVEYQWLTNKFKDNDSRFLNHISYRW